MLLFFDYSIFIQVIVVSYPKILAISKIRTKVNKAICFIIAAIYPCLINYEEGYHVL